MARQLSLSSCSDDSLKDNKHRPGLKSVKKRAARASEVKAKEIAGSRAW
jgi:hypothetical protein